ELNGAINLYEYNSPNNKRWFNAWDLQFQSRVLGGTVFGGASWGQQYLVTCDVQDPNYVSMTFTGVRFCDQSQFGQPYRAQYKVSGSYPLPFGVGASASFQSYPGGSQTASGGDTSQNEIYNISQATFRTLTGQTLTQSQVQAA